MTKFDKWIERITNQPNYDIMEKEMLNVIQNAPDKYYLALFIKPYLTHVNNPNVNQLYRYLESPYNYTIYIPSTIQQVLIDCRSNERVFELVKLFISTFNY